MNYRTEKILPAGEAFAVNESLAGLVPMAIVEEQTLLTVDIKQNGLITPVTLWNNEVVDGRCRQTACLLTNTPIRAIDLDDNLTEDDVKAYVKAVNTRRNLTRTQKVMAAARESYKSQTTILAQAKSWGISDKLVKNARWLYKNEGSVAEALFNGKSIKLPSGKVSNKVSTIYAFYKSVAETIVTDTAQEYGWQEATFITTQTGKNWYYETTKSLGVDNVAVCKLLAELANYKFHEET